MEIDDLEMNLLPAQVGTNDVTTNFFKISSFIQNRAVDSFTAQRGMNNKKKRTYVTTGRASVDVFVMHKTGADRENPQTFSDSQSLQANVNISGK